jgi:hypothetical protein
VSATRLTDAEIQQLADWWWRTKDVVPSEPSTPKLVSFAELRPCGVGAVVAAAIREELRQNGYSEGVRW